MPNPVNKERCTGCTACMNACPRDCIEMRMDSFGFSFPELVCPDRCLDCGVCEAVCPVINPPSISEAPPDVLAARSTDESLRADSSSGGIFSELAAEILRQNGTVYGAAYGDRFEVYHRPAETFAELSLLRGAKYAESRLGTTFSHILERLNRGQSVLFAGTPCQVAGLKAFLGRDYQNLLCVDFVCHGVPAPAVWETYVDYRAKQDNGGHLPTEINLRSKHTGWSKYRYSNLFRYADGTLHSTLSSESLFMQLFVGDFINRPSCAQCPFKGCSRVSDITLGDFWGIWDIAPEMDDDRGISLVLLQSEQGRRIFAGMGARILSKAVSPEEAGRQNPSLLVSSPSAPNRTQVLKLAAAGEFQAVIPLLARSPAPAPSLLKRLGRKLIHTVKGS